MEQKECMKDEQNIRKFAMYFITSIGLDPTKKEDNDKLQLLLFFAYLIHKNNYNECLWNEEFIAGPQGRISNQSKISITLSLV